MTSAIRHSVSLQYKIPDDWNFDGARRLFFQPNVLPGSEIKLKWTPPDADGLVKFLSDDRQFDKERVLRVVERIKATMRQSTQTRLEVRMTFNVRAILTGQGGLRPSSGPPPSPRTSGSWRKRRLTP